MIDSIEPEQKIKVKIKITMPFIDGLIDGLLTDIGFHPNMKRSINRVCSVCDKHNIHCTAYAILSFFRYAKLEGTEENINAAIAELEATYNYRLIRK